MAEIDSTALFSLSYGLYVISANSEGRESGCVANTLIQVTSAPAKLSVTLNKDNYTTSLIEKSGRFTAAVLSTECPMNLIANFGFRSGRDADKFAAVDFAKDSFGVKYPADGVVSALSCRVESVLDVGTHKVFAGVLEEAKPISKQEPMTYAYYHKFKKGTTPKNAPSFQEKKPEQKGFRCTVCGYIYEGETLPEDFRCPICGVGADKFEKL